MGAMTSIQKYIGQDLGPFQILDDVIEYYQIVGIFTAS
jgi:hypothetical protein